MFGTYFFPNFAPIYEQDKSDGDWMRKMRVCVRIYEEYDRVLSIKGKTGKTFNSQTKKNIDLYYGITLNKHNIIFYCETEKVHNL